jgi:hypothetical protein
MTRTGDRSESGFCSENLTEIYHLEDLGADGEILKWILKREYETVWTGFIKLWRETGGRGGGALVNTVFDILVPRRDGELLHYLTNYLPLEKNFAQSS